MRPYPVFAPSFTTLRLARRLLRSWVRPRLGADDLAWLEGACRDALEGPEGPFFMAFSAACRHAPKDPLALTREETAKLEHVRPGWDPADWTVEQAVRTSILLHRDARDRTRWLGEIEKLFENGDLGELVALYQALPLLPHPESLVERCAEGIRTNMTDVFRAIAHRNPFPAEQLPDRAWNQMVLKALFVEVPLHPVVGLDERANPVLARMLCDYAHERWAAGRPVSPELWRCVGPHADSSEIKDLERALDTGDEATREAAVDALRRCPWPEAEAVLGKHGFQRREEDS